MRTSTIKSIRQNLFLPVSFFFLLSVMIFPSPPAFAAPAAIGGKAKHKCPEAKPPLEECSEEGKDCGNNSATYYIKKDECERHVFACCAAANYACTHAKTNPLTSCPFDDPDNRCDPDGGEPNENESGCKEITVKLKKKQKGEVMKKQKGEVMASFLAYVPYRTVKCQPYWCVLRGSKESTSIGDDFGTTGN